MPRPEAESGTCSHLRLDSPFKLAYMLVYMPAYGDVLAETCCSRAAHALSAFDDNNLISFMRLPRYYDTRA
eukprot:2119635-Pleurochrysis_carterae.AAC.1